jgi:hypothetical protein
MENKVQLIKPLKLSELYTTWQNHRVYVAIARQHIFFPKGLECAVVFANDAVTEESTCYPDIGSSGGGGILLVKNTQKQYKSQQLLT